MPSILFSVQIYLSHIWLLVGLIYAYLSVGYLMCLLLNVHGVSEVSQTVLHTTEPLVPVPFVFKYEVAV
jgi:hypothetical protein